MCPQFSYEEMGMCPRARTAPGLIRVLRGAGPGLPSPIDVSPPLAEGEGGGERMGAGNFFIESL